MSEPVIYKGRGNSEMYDDLMDFLNYVFGFNGNESDFKKLLPKLYNPECDPSYANYVVTENGKLKGAVGAFDFEQSVCSTTLKVRGIGNVAVHPYSRSKGYMIDCMNMALSDMVKDGVDYSILGGRRQRYNYFGFESIGSEYSLHINSNNIRYVYGDSPLPELEFKNVTSDDSELLDKMYELHASRPQHVVRPREKFLDICHTWQAPLVSILRDKKFIGYYIGGITELLLVDPNDFSDFIRNYVSRHGKVNLHIPAWDSEILDRAAEICENISLSHCDMFNIFNYKRVVSAFLNFSASTTSLADGEITVNIHGYAGDESLLIYVENGVPFVEEYSGKCDLTLDHREAMTFFFGIYSKNRAKTPSAVRSWFPLKLFVENADHV